MITRVNWLLRFSIFMNVVAVLVIFHQLYHQAPVRWQIVPDIGTPECDEPKSSVKSEAVPLQINLASKSNRTNDEFAAAFNDTLPNKGKLQTKLKTLIKCHHKGYDPERVQRGEFWVLKNYIRADHVPPKCYETVTYTTHGDLTFLDNLIPMLERWNAPVSIALYAPGTDFIPTVNTIKYLRDCAAGGQLVRQYTTFHIFFNREHIPKIDLTFDGVLDQPYNCSAPAPNITSDQLYKTQKKILYPINVGRNIAREAAVTHFVLPCDIELYPSDGLATKFLEMIARNDVQLQKTGRKVFVLPPFEVNAASQVPHDKTELQQMLHTKKAIPFHVKVCSLCHKIPKLEKWIAANETEQLGIFHTAKRTDDFVSWEPFYIGTNADPYFDERLSWEGKQDKMSQAYVLCALDYDFQILDNAFLIHRPGIKVYVNDEWRNKQSQKTHALIDHVIQPELNVIYGSHEKCYERH